jgi:hypothetical protein
LANGVSQLGGTPIEVHGPEIPQAARPDSSNYISAVLEFAATTFQPSAIFEGSWCCCRPPSALSWGTKSTTTSGQEPGLALGV